MSTMELDEARARELEEAIERELGTSLGGGAAVVRLQPRERKEG